MLPDFIKAAAVERNVDPNAVNSFYNERRTSLLTDPFFSKCLDPDSPECVQINLKAALTLAVESDNSKLGYEYARAYMLQDQEKVDDCLSRIVNVPADRHDGIHHHIKGFLRSFCLTTCLPSVPFEIDDQHIITHKMDVADTETFHRLFSQRNPIVEGFIQQNKQPDNDLKTQIKNSEHFHLTVTARWHLDNLLYDFPSVTDYSARLSYDSPREAAGRNAVAPISPKSDPALQS